jgi:hypothetical protein
MPHPGPSGRGFSFGELPLRVRGKVVLGQSVKLFAAMAPGLCGDPVYGTEQFGVHGDAELDAHRARGGWGFGGS